jgi:glycosyltransferase involved in cell wall biosynthesis
VAVALHEPELGGATTALLRVLPELERVGWEFKFWVPGPGAAEAELRRLGHSPATEPRRLRFSRASLRQPPGAARRLASVPGYLQRWRAWLAAQDADLLHANSLLALPETVSRPRAGPPAVLYVHEVLPEGLKGSLAARLARRADRVAAVSQAAAASLRRKRIEATVVHPAAPPAPVVRDLAQRDKLVVGTLGTVCRRKGSDLFLSAARQVAAQHDGIEFRMAGNVVVGGERRWAEQVVTAAAKDGVRHLPAVDAFAELAEWDIFVLPSRRDPFPLAVLEAMAAGLPVVATRVDGIPEQVGDDAGLLVPPEDPDAIAAAVLELAKSSELRAELGAAARRRVEHSFTLEQQATGLERVYRDALRRRA